MTTEDQWPDQWTGTTHHIYQIGPPYTDPNVHADITITADAIVTFIWDGTLPSTGLESYTLRDATITYRASGTTTTIVPPNYSQICSVLGSGAHQVTRFTGSGRLFVYGPLTPPGSADNRKVAEGRADNTQVWYATTECPNLPPMPFPASPTVWFLIDPSKTYHVSDDYKYFSGNWEEPLQFTDRGTVKITRSWDLQFNEGGIAPDINPACPNRTITFRPKGSPPLGPVTWSCDGNPATGTGITFQTRFDTPGDHTVKATETTESGPRTATAQVHISEHSGRRFAERHPGSKDLNELKDRDPDSFQQRVRRFIQALEDAGATVTVGSTYRSDETQYLMHYAWRIAHGDINPADVPPWPGIDICWDWLNEDGTQDLGASSLGAQELVDAYHMVNYAAKPPYSHHRDHLAVDLSISWHGNITVRNVTLPDGTVGNVTLQNGTGIPETDSMNRQLWNLGQRPNFDITHNQGTDWPHWSPDGS